MTPEALDHWRWEQVIRETDSKYDRDYERVAWAREASCHHTRLVREDVRPGVDHFADAGKPIIRDGGEG